mgnify:CR=1 FL=1
MKEKSFASLPVFLVDDEESVLHASAAVLHSAGVANIQMVSDSRELVEEVEALLGGDSVRFKDIVEEAS